MPRHDGGPAFPVVEPDVEGQQRAYVGSYGMSLRDYFAAQALVGMLANVRTDGSHGPSLVKAAYDAADAMLKERDKYGTEAV